MNNLDLINASFEMSACLFVLNHCRVLMEHKETRGVSIVSMLFFTVWGFWNLVYYPALGQMFSMLGGVFVVLANAVYVMLMITYRRKAG